MYVNAITIRREGYYGNFGRGDPTKPFRATIEVEGAEGKVELNLSPDLSKGIVELIAEEVARAGRVTAEAMVASMLTPIEAQATKPAIESSCD